MEDRISLARQLIAECKELQSNYLDLGNCGVNNFNEIPELFECTQIETLILCETWLDENDDIVYSINNNTADTPTDARNTFTSLPEEFIYLINLKKIICFHEMSYSRRSVNIDVLSKLTSLESLVVNGCYIEEFNFLQNLSRLKSLDIGSNTVSNASYLANFSNLVFLDIGENQITDFAFLSALKKLKRLRIYGSNLTDCRFLSELVTLERLNLYNNKIADCSPLANLKKLNALYLEKNIIGHLPPSIFHLEMPIFLASPRGEGSGVGLYVDDNPIESPPIEILKQGRQSVLDWFEANKETLNEIKVILIGDPKAGKTSLLRRLKDDTFDNKEPQTDGINIEHIPFGSCAHFKSQESLHKLTAHFWDFGGQEIMNATHQFFLTKRSVYLLVLDARKDQKVAEQVRMWVKRIKATGGNSPIIVVANQADVNPGFGFSNEIDLQQEFPQISAFLMVSCLTGDGIDKLKQKLEDLIPKAELFNTEIDERWISIMKQLQEETKSKPYLDEARFNKICDENRLPKSGRKNAINFLNDLGLVLHFDNLNLAEYYVLDPYWITYGVYQIVTSAYAGTQKGIVPMNMLEYIVNEEEDKKQVYQPAQYHKIIYDSTNQRRFLVDILNQFKLCFYLPGNAQFIIPDLLDTTEPIAVTRPIRQDPDGISFAYNYDYMPGSVMPYIMVEAHWLMIEKWRTGCVLAYNDCTALISNYQNRLTITVIGEHKKKREFMAVIRNLIDEFNQDLTDKPAMLIPLPGINAFAEYEVLLNRERKGRKEYIHDEDKATESVFEISQLLEGIPGDDEMKKMRLLIRKILASSGRIETKLDEQFNYLVEKSNVDSEKIINAIMEISGQQASLIVTDIMQFLSDSFKLQDSEIEEKLKNLYADLKKSDDVEMKLKLSIPFIKLLGIDLEAQFDVKSWSKKMYEKYQLSLFKLLT